MHISITSPVARKRLFSDKVQRKRYAFSLLMIMCMTGVAEWTGEKEIIFPEMAALTIGLWIVDKRVWIVSKSRLIALMTAGATAGLCITRYSPWPLIVNIGLAFTFAASCLQLLRCTLVPLLSACILPVLLHSASWTYPLSVFLMSLLLAGGQTLMEKQGLRPVIRYTPSQRDRKKELLQWLLLLSTVLIISVIPVYTAYIFCILPPLIVTYVEFARSKAGFRNRPVQIYLLLVTAALLGSFTEWAGHVYLHLPQAAVAFILFIVLFGIFEWTGKFFAPAGATALIPMIIPRESLLWFPLQIAVGAAVFITAAMIIFLKCYKWPKARLVVCLVPTAWRNTRKPGKIAVTRNERN